MTETVAVATTLLTFTLQVALGVEVGAKGQGRGGELGFTARNFYKRNKSDGFELHAGGREQRCRRTTRDILCSSWGREQRLY